LLRFAQPYVGGLRITRAIGTVTRVIWGDVRGCRGRGGVVLSSVTH
jgi:hypothetical protein